MSQTVTAKELMDRMVKGYNPSVFSGDTDVTFQFTGAEKATYYLEFRGGRVSLHQGELSYCKLTIEVDLEKWAQILDKQAPFNLMDRSFVIKGNNFALLAKFPQLFGFA